MERVIKLFWVFFLLGALSVGCRDSKDDSDLDGSVETDGQPGFDSGDHDGQPPIDSGHADGAAPDGTIPDGEICNRDPGPDDRERKVVVSKLYTSNGDPSNAYEALDMAVEGTFAFPGDVFSMTRSTYSRIVFTPDGKIGIVAQEDGSLGVFSVNTDGSISVVHESFEGEFYASKVVMDPAGQRVFVLSTQWREHGGGIYSVRVNCDGTLTEEGLWAPAKLPYGMVFLPDKESKVVVAAKDILNSPAERNVHLLTWGPSPSVIDSVDAFGHDDFIIESFAVTNDGNYVLLGDNSGFSAEPNSVAIVQTGATGLEPVQLLSPVEDPFDIVTSPYNNAAMVISGFGDVVISITYDPNNQAAPFALGTTVSTPPLPAKAVLIDRGQLTGWVFISENTGIRKLVFESNGSITDLGVTSPGSGLENMIGSIGVQP